MPAPAARKMMKPSVTVMMPHTWAQRQRLNMWWGGGCQDGAGEGRGGGGGECTDGVEQGGIGAEIGVEHVGGGDPFGAAGEG